MGRLLMLLAPPRSFSSLVSTMIGQHPQIYGFPELHIMIRGTVGALLKRSRGMHHFLGPPGLLRSISELMLGGQTGPNALSAANWLEDRSHWATSDLMAFMVDLACETSGAAFALEKSPELSFLPHRLESVRRSFPDALYVHVTRHPLTLKRSLVEGIESLSRYGPEEREALLHQAHTIWPMTQRNILDFCGTLAPGQFLRIRGEDVLSDAPRVMEQVAEWMGLRTDPEAIARMLRPEESPYASIGPVGAQGGGDTKFLLSPKFRPGRPRLPTLDGYFATPEGQSLGHERRAYLEQLAHCLGYR